MISVSDARDSIQSGEGWALEEDTGCWLWSEPSASGYGPYLSFHRATYGEAPDGFEVAHICRGGRKGCVRPSHLDLVAAGSVLPNLAEPALAQELRSSFAARIKDERAARRMTQEEFAREMRVSVMTIRNWESGRKTPLPETYRAIARKLGWNGRRRKYTVVFVHEVIVTAGSTGEAMRKVWDEIDREGRPRKSRLFHVRPATK